MSQFSTYWIYSVGLAIVWAVGLTIAINRHGRTDAQTYLLVFGGYCLGWVNHHCPLYVSTTKALAHVATPPVNN